MEYAAFTAALDIVAAGAEVAAPAAAVTVAVVVAVVASSEAVATTKTSLAIQHISNARLILW